ncbi:collagen alpha-2(XI) chain-like [Erythrolamprus reginae]|uniref:collagen alpha-2(XI) chain-like n=1 Tax=Erythrolamprus reginae TaxID=121349 RepID=UPI00396C8528
MTLQKGEFPLVLLLLLDTPNAEVGGKLLPPNPDPRFRLSGWEPPRLSPLSVERWWSRLIHGFGGGRPGAAGGGAGPDPRKRRGEGEPRPFPGPDEARVPLPQRDAAGEVPALVNLRPAGDCPLRQRARGVRGCHGVGEGGCGLVEQRQAGAAVQEGLCGSILPVQLRGFPGGPCGWPESQAHRHHLPHQDGANFPQHHPPLHNDGLLPRGDRGPVAEEQPAGEGGRGLWGGAPEWRLDLPAPCDAGDPAPAGGRLHLQGGARQPGGPHHRPVGAPFLPLCQCQNLDRDYGGCDRSGLPGCGALLLPEGQESNSHPTTCSTRELILLSTFAIILHHFYAWLPIVTGRGLGFLNGVGASQLQADLQIGSLCAGKKGFPASWWVRQPPSEIAYNNSVHSSTGLTPFQVTSDRDFVPMPELPTEPPSSIMLVEWMEKLKRGCEDTKKVLTEAAQAYKKQADKH